VNKQQALKVPTWFMRCEYDSGKIVDLDDQVAETPQLAISKTFSSPDWHLVRITSDDYQSCWHFRLKDAKLTVYVWEND
jgi:hypothetical protein